ncbi:MarR family transcriptional regulator [Aureimonas altamirensis]|uniref:MarR family winged helix-turn-helix transcriptional regulator n=1 Tax=Aureimonas altamirensis TaxID=370622 RepID=UPI001E5CF017|nr:MarR family transcriptional regulator [Aureimonas altamirensis]UHD45232.1 MarR family transcriptional regulator [Aureimonas altamirensis]
MGEELIDLLAEVSSQLQARLAELPALGAFGLGDFQAKVLAFIGRNPNCTQQGIATRMRRDKGQIARAIKEIEGRGFVARSTHDTDWRSSRMCLSEEGGRIFHILQTQRAGVSSQVMRSL